MLSPTAEIDWHSILFTTAEKEATMRAQHHSTADEIDILVHRQGKAKARRTAKRASARRDRRTARHELRN
ncbi:hypothetical protein [Rhodococcus sp. H29-C3]|uniref:hypothetical protein n=1 Tax=Rhodococcus sp. H29-C3 TaxID=3046307 RepID=UPI0024BAC6F7|nr:hypothetical protein [Rhodococcus sp. H29-C3]MDJ0363149.1 hypothetical protein [Rhodococcus sp. H29-C3]